MYGTSNGGHAADMHAADSTGSDLSGLIFLTKSAIHFVTLDPCDRHFGADDEVVREACRECLFHVKQQIAVWSLLRSGLCACRARGEFAPQFSRRAESRIRCYSLLKSLLSPAFAVWTNKQVRHRPPARPSRAA
jgi:hypothetical protein